MTETKWYTGPVYVLVALALVLSFSLMPATTSMVSAQGATGTFLAGNFPTVTIVYVPASATPVTEMDIPVNVSNADRNLSELSNITFEFWYDADGGVPSSDEFNTSPISTQEGIAIVWDIGGGFSGLIANASTLGNASWVKLTCTAPDLNATNGIFWFNFTIGKVAKKTTGNATWQIAAYANDTYFGGDFGYDAEGVTMDFYSEVSISPSSPTVDWGLVPTGLDFGDNTASEQPLGANVTYIVNSNYTQNVSSSADWTNATAANATLDATGTCANAQNFSLKADDTGTLPGGNLVAVSPGVAIDTGTITGDGTDDGGAGNKETANTLWLKLANTFETARYTGTLTYSVASA